MLLLTFRMQLLLCSFFSLNVGSSIVWVHVSNVYFHLLRHLLVRFPGYVLVAALNLTNVTQKSEGIDE